MHDRISFLRRLASRLGCALLAGALLSCGGADTTPAPTTAQEQGNGKKKIMAVGTPWTFSDPTFFTEVVATLPAFSPVGLTWTPDGRMLVWTKNGTVRVVKNGTLLPTPFIDISAHVNSAGDRGLLGLAVDGNFAQNG